MPRTLKALELVFQRRQVDLAAAGETCVGRWNDVPHLLRPLANTGRAPQLVEDLKRSTVVAKYRQKIIQLTKRYNPTANMLKPIFA